MPKTVREVPPPLELLCLNALWSLKEGNVKDVQQIVARKRPLAYTTIMTVLDRLVRKSLLARRKVGRAFVYVPQMPKDRMRGIAVRELLEGFFDGSEEELIHFLGAKPVDAAAAAAAAASGGPATAQKSGEPGLEEPEPPIDTVLL
jgi:BlaI family transcriptional regulator, penicillinase repressor